MRRVEHGNPRQILFDFDGTLVNSSRLHDTAFRETLALYAPAYSNKFKYNDVRGQSTRIVWERLGIKDPKLVAEMVAYKQSRYRLFVNEGRLETMAGAHEVLQWVKERGCGAFLVTGGSRESVHAGLKSTKLEGLLDGIITEEDAARGKPAPDPYLQCLRKFALKRESCLAVEDAMSGLLACRAANIAVLGVHESDIREEVELWCPDLYALRAELSRLFSREGAQ